MNPNYMIKNYEEEYWTDISALYRDVFNRELSKEYFQWKNINNPQGKSIIKVTVDDDKVIGFSAIWKANMVFMGEEKILAGQSVDAMVHKNHRKKGIFENMALVALEDMRAQGLQIRFNFPNEAAYKASIGKLKIRKVCHIPQYIKILRGREAASMFTANKLAKLAGGGLLDIWRSVRSIGRNKESDYAIAEIESFDEEFDVLWGKVKDDYPIAVVRSSQYLNWRYKSTCNAYKAYGAYKNGELCGYIVTALEEKRGKDDNSIILGHIVDIISIKEHKDALFNLIYEAEKQMESDGACAVSCWMIKEWFYSEILRKTGFLQFRCPSVLAALAVSEKAKAAGDFLYDHENWYVTIGDSDYI